LESRANESLMTLAGIPTHKFTHSERFLQSLSATWQPPRERKSLIRRICLACHGRGREFESRRPCHSFQVLGKSKNGRLRISPQKSPQIRPGAPFPLAESRSGGSALAGHLPFVNYIDNRFRRIFRQPFIAYSPAATRAFASSARIFLHVVVRSVFCATTACTKDRVDLHQRLGVLGAILAP